MKRKANALSLCLAAALLLGLSQCKKQETPTTPTTEPVAEGIRITLNVEDGSRHEVIPGNEGVVHYTYGDKIYVGDGTKYIGTLTNTGSTGGTGSHFEGTILSPSDGTTHLHFYFVGGLETGTLTKGSTTSFAVDISDQSSNLPVLSYGNAPYAKDATSYTCKLMNKCGLVKVEFAVATSEVVSLSASTSEQDFLTHANINFDLNNDNSAIVPTGIPGSIKLYSQNGRKKWAILLPQTLPNGTESVQAIITIGTEGTNTYNVKVPEITENTYTSIMYGNYVPNSIIYNLPNYDVSNNYYAVFSVSDDKFVSFSKGNLQYQPSSSTWHFADNQWDYVGTHPEGETGYGTVDGSDNAEILKKNYSGWMDLFGWGTWTGNSPKPLQISEEAEYIWDNNDFAGEFDSHDNWRTLTASEWSYLLTERNKHIIIENEVSSVYAYAKKKCAFATVKGVKGIIILPDNWTGDFLFGETTVTNNGIQFGSSYTYTYSESEWDNNMKNKGAVFLPAAGNRTVTIKTTTEDEPPTTTTDTLINVYVPGEKGYYWTSTTDSHNYVEFDNTGVTTNYTTNYTFGCSVRLVRDIE